MGERNLAELGRTYREMMMQKDQQAAELAPRAGFAPPQLPQVDVSAEQKGRPLSEIGGGISAPMAGGTIGLSGTYQPDRYAPEWTTRLNYRRPF